MKKILFCLLAFYTPVSIVIAQNTTNSPTSMFGLGELSTGKAGNMPDWAAQALHCEEIISLTMPIRLHSQS